MAGARKTLSERAFGVRTTSVGYLINKTAAKMDRTMTAVLKPLGVSIDQFAILMTLTESEGITQSEIGKRVGLASYTVTRLLDDLAAKKLVVRKPNRESRRSFSIYLTPKGKTLSPRLFQAVADVNRAVLAPLSDDETEQLRETLSKLVFET